MPSWTWSWNQIEKLCGSTSNSKFIIAIAKHNLEQAYENDIRTSIFINLFSLFNKKNSKESFACFYDTINIIHYNRAMDNAYQLNLEDFSEPSDSFYNSYLNTKKEDKFSGTITKNFFKAEFLNEDQDYIDNSSYLKNERQSKPQSGQEDKNRQNSRRERRSNNLKLAPIQQPDKIQVFKNLANNTKPFQKVQTHLEVENIEQIEQHLPEKKRVPRKRGKKEEKQAEKDEQYEITKLRQKNNEIFFDDEDQNSKERTQQIRQQLNQTISVPLTRINNQFVQSDDEAVEVSTEQVQNYITGSQYFNFNSEQVLIRQLNLDVRDKTTLKMEILRDKGGFNTFWPQFHLHFTEDSKHLMSAKKTSSRPTSTFIISRSQTIFEQQSPFYLGKMKSNVLGDVMNIFGKGPNPSNAKQKNTEPRELLATVVFMTSLFQMGKPRQFVVYLKRPQVKYYKDFSQVSKYEDEIPLNTLYEFPENKQKIRVIKNRQPVWVNQIGGYMLNFRGRVQRPSIKNFIIEEQPNGRDVVLFGKVNDNKFNFDISSGISTYIAFAIALSSFDSRLMCE